MFPLLLSIVSCERWAVLMAGSKDWWNYRHQADIATIYTTLLKRGFSPERIITLSYDDMPTCSFNKYKNQLFHTTAHVNMYQGPRTIDYSNKAVTKETFFNVLLGTSDGKKLESTEEDDVLIYFDDHGAPGVLGLPTGKEGIPMDELAEVIESMHVKKMYKRLFFIAEACSSGHLPYFIKSPNTVVMTAATAGESSYPTNYDEDIDNDLSNQFTNAVLETLEANDQMTLENFHKAVNYSTLNSTPQIGGGGYEELKDLPVSVFWGSAPKNTLKTAVSHRIIRKQKPAMYDQRTYSRYILGKAKDLESKIILRKKEANRQLMLIRLEQIAKFLGLDLDTILNLHKTDKKYNDTPNINWKAYFNVLKAFTSKFEVDEDDMDLFQFFINVIPFTTEEKIKDIISFIE